MKRTRLVLIAAAVVVAGVALAWFWPFGGREDVLRLPGVVEVREVRLGSKIGGRVEKVEVEEGETVNKGQVLVRLAAPEVKAQIEQWQGKLESARAALQKAENGPRTQEKEAALAALEAAKVRLGRLERGERDEDRRAAEADLALAKSELSLAQEEFDRVERSYRKGAASTSERDSARSSLERSRARVNAARARLERTEKGRKEDVDEARQEVKRLEAEYDLLKEGTRYEDRMAARAAVEEIQGKLAELKANLAEATIKAPSRARVEVLAVREGDLAAPNQPLLRILNRDDRWVKVYVPETELGRVRMQQEVEVTCDAYPGRRFKGTVILIAGEGEFTPRNVQSADERKHQVFGIKVRVDDPDEVFKSGMAAEVIVPLR